MGKWDYRFVNAAQFYSEWSSDPSTKVGAVVVGNNNEILATGYNGFPRGVKEALSDVEFSRLMEKVPIEDAPLALGIQQRLLKRYERPSKYLYTEHAERNAIYNAARVGARLEGATLYMNYYPLPCADCARAIIQSGIKRIVGPNIPFPGVGQQWKDHMSEAEIMLKEAGVELVVVDEGS